MTAEQALVWARDELRRAAETEQHDIVRVYRDRIIPGLVRVCAIRHEHAA